MAIDSLNGINTLTATYLNASAVSAALTINGGVDASTAAGVDQSAVQRAIDQATQASAIVSLSNANLLAQTEALTYNPAGLLGNQVAINNASAAAQAIAAADQAAQLQSGTDQPALSVDQSSSLFYAGLLSGLSSVPATAALYTDGGSVTGIDSAYATQLAQVLQANPDLADTITGDIAAQGVTGALLSVTV